MTYYTNTLLLDAKEAEMLGNQYRIWFWTEQNEKKCYVVGLTNPEKYKEILKHQYNRFIMEKC